jgi:hypothetical protein
MPPAFIAPIDTTKSITKLTPILKYEKDDAPGSDNKLTKLNPV